MSRRFRKKPVVIEATQYDGTDESWRRIDEWADNIAIHLDFDDDYFICIPTLEGEMRCSKGDWIIKGVQGELYPCKPDIFEQTYEAVESEADNE